MQSLTVGLALGLFAAATAAAADSQCFGTVANGRIEHAVRLPASGANFSAYSALGVAAGRTYVHSRVAGAIAESYAALAKALPDTHFVYGETGWAQGGRLKPHRTHQNGLSVDFFVPVRGADGRPARLPISLSNRLGYDIEFDAQGRLGEQAIDFDAIAEHLYALHRAAAAHGIGIAKVIIDPPFLPRLFATRRGAYLKQNLSFMKRSAWVRHDEHYHVDFALPCKAL